MSQTTETSASDGPEVSGSVAAAARGPIAAEPTDGEGSGRWSVGHIPGEAGIWIFILGDMTLYAALFGSFIYDRSAHVEQFNTSSATLHTAFGMVNTLLLLVSSISVVYGIRSVREGLNPKRAPLFFKLAFLCALGFVVNKFFEYSDLLHNQLDPTENTFYTYYYILTGIHLTHLLAGMAVLVFLWKVAAKPKIAAPDIRAMESGASFWHVVDLLWIVLFPLLYLVS